MSPNTTLLTWTTATFCLISSIALAQVPASRDTVVLQGRRDTVVYIQRDTVVMVQRDTVLLEDQRPVGTRADEYERDAAAEREARLELREQRYREYEEWLAAQPIRRPDGMSQAIKFYPSKLMRVDFPSFLVGIERTYDGKYGAEATLGLLVSPSQLWSDGFGGFEAGSARFGLRGFTAGLEGRLYLAERYRAFPFYLGLEFSYSLAPLDMELWTDVDNGTFEQRRDVPVNAQDISVAVTSGWQLRTASGLVVDMAPGLRFGIKGIYSANDAVQQAIDDRSWNLFNGRTPYADLVLRVGLGKGRWVTAPREGSKRKGKRTRGRR